MNLADIHILPQRAGAADLVMPSKLTGIMASGRPAVALAAEGTQIADLVSRFGTVVEPENASLLADALRGLAGDADKRRRMGDEARRIAVETLDRDAVLTQLLEELNK